MGSVTRDLLPFAVGRNLSETVTLVTLLETPLDDGSSDFYKEEVPVLARVVPLTPNEITRLQEGGMTIKAGLSVSVTGELAKAPDEVIQADGTRSKVVQFTIEEGASIMIADTLPLGNDGPSYPSGYS